MDRSQNGFTLIELLVVTLLIAILTAISVPQLFGTKERAYIAAMRADLRNLETAQESYYVDNITYAAATADLGTTFLSSPNVTIAIDSASQTGWGGTSSHSATARICSVAVSRTLQGVPTCP